MTDSIVHVSFKFIFNHDRSTGILVGPVHVAWSRTLSSICCIACRSTGVQEKYR